MRPAASCASRYEGEVYNSEKYVELPFVTGIISELSGVSAQPVPAIADRKFFEIDVDGFIDRMKAIRPHPEFVVPSTLSGDAQLFVDLSFNQLEEFSSAAIAQNIEPLARLLDVRTQVANL
ncbi:MAG: type VI secretion system contractile sheath small subunit [Janthinobacterium lividum]